MKTTKIKAKFVIGHDGKSHVVYRGGEVVYRGDTIIFAGRGYDGHVDETIDTGASIVGPGFIDLEADIDTDHALQVVFEGKPARGSQSRLYLHVNISLSHI
jgi:cytosine/adenosine deaminase-related metal-dependent hydrolase